MANFFDKLPSILILGVLVGIFLSLRRRVRSARLSLWTAAWVLIFIHFFVGIFEPKAGSPAKLVLAIDLGSLQVAATLFLASLTSFVEDRRKTWALLAVTALPGLIFCVDMACTVDGSQFRLLNTLCLAIIFFAPPAFIFIPRYKRDSTCILCIPVLIAAGAASIYSVWRNEPIFGFTAMRSLSFGIPSFLFWRRYRRWSPAVVTNVSGFALWAAVFPAAMAFDKYFPNLPLNPEIWNVPRFFVAFGMILLLLEDNSEVLEVASRREHKLNEQLQKFAGITSRLLTGGDLNSFCSDIAVAIRETSTFNHAIILLGTDDRSLYIAGQSGIDEELLIQFKRFVVRWQISDVKEAFRSAVKIGANSYLMPPDQVDRYWPIKYDEEVPPNPYWQRGCRLIIPLQSSRGVYVGCVILSRPRDVFKVNGQEMSKIEILCGDLASTIDNTTLHRQLVRSEKLAAIGQLVAGVAHELNNPLASIVGYAELMGDEVPQGPVRQKLEKLTREAQRMKRIIENLLRFARRNNLEKKSADIEALLHEVLALREYHIRNNGVEVRLEIQPNLPHVALDEDQFKQILLNLLNNSIDALECVRKKRISVGAVRKGDRVCVHFEDAGPGFADVNRAFDPFYTTKPVGKGTGLGLSICYGIVKEHGGDIYAMNTMPTGARVVLELPVSLAVAAG
jgi:two-component system, NtrC family, sensor kinase